MTMALSQITSIVADIGSNIVKACTLLHENYRWQQGCCATHSLELSLKEAFFSLL